MLLTQIVHVFRGFKNLTLGNVTLVKVYVLLSHEKSHIIF